MQPTPSPTARPATPQATPTNPPQFRAGAGVFVGRNFYLEGDVAMVASADASVFTPAPLPTLKSNLILGGATYFLSPSVGWASSSQYNPDGSCTLTIYKTTNGGAGWQKEPAIPIKFCANGGVESFTFRDALHGWMSVATVRGLTTNAGQVYSTSDGGVTWRALALEPPGDLWFTSATTGWLVAGQVPTVSNLLLVTDDGGQTWRLVKLPLPAEQEGQQTMAYVGAPMWFTAEAGFIAVGYESGAQPNTLVTLAFYLTSDGGATWQMVKQQQFSANFGGVPEDTAIGGHGYVGYGDTLLYSADVGLSWTTLAGAPPAVTYNSLHFTDTLHGWAFDQETTCNGSKADPVCASTNTLWRTADGGQTWNSAEVSS